MTAAADASHRLDRVENDVTAIYEMLGSIQGAQRQQGSRLDQIDGKLDQVLRLLQDR